MASENPTNQSLEWGDKTDAALVLSLRQGDKAALAVLYDRYSRLVYTVAFRILNNGPESEDLTQEIFLNLWQKQTYDPTRSALSSFLSTVTRNRAIDRVRSRSNRRRILKGMVPQTVPDFSVPVEQASQGERSQRVRAALQNLPEKQRELLWLAYFHGFSQSEIASHTNIPLGTVKSRMRQGLLKLKGTLQDLVD
ncbi:sigma-70 family RNA polymerase sigma factor [Leptolyngbya cf. ectocarpi LEGE 11479]|uniref:Sigma-70 family RNA polymerase sigma factor n=1 Tax=Leptolyngbya cf. ectocarpi LEGE 11479 TaxID=1828722 RepID=A0A929F9K0_LEPEC|nr:sigma-70 family RNA polymerase sigma factor [Leptolyngbya ectocarpi]MBE9067448.1 sigma-70 family RNA polymerase sigma factor [Leptolyngbya cf. ectocarpi LEGE 11479]